VSYKGHLLEMTKNRRRERGGGEEEEEEEEAESYKQGRKNKNINKIS